MPIIPDPPITDYEPFYRPGMVTVTCHVLGRESIFRLDAAVHTWHVSLRRAQTHHPFRMVAFAILPERVELLLLLPEGDSPRDAVERAKAYFTADYRTLMGDPGRMVVWERGFDSSLVLDAGRFARKLDTIHYAPVGARLVIRPEDWPHTSFPIWVERGLYPLGWGWERPNRLNTR